MSAPQNSSAATPSADQLADQRIMREITICIGVMVLIAIAIATTANSIA